MVAVVDRPPFLKDAVSITEFDDDIEHRRQDRNDVGVAVQREMIVDHAVGVSGAAVGQVGEFEDAFGAVLLEQRNERIDGNAEFARCEAGVVAFELLDGVRDGDSEVGERGGGGRGVVGLHGDGFHRLRAAVGGGSAPRLRFVVDECGCRRLGVVAVGEM